MTAIDFDEGYAPRPHLAVELLKKLGRNLADETQGLLEDHDARVAIKKAALDKQKSEHAAFLAAYDRKITHVFNSFTFSPDDRAIFKEFYKDHLWEKKNGRRRHVHLVGRLFKDHKMRNHQTMSWDDRRQAFRDLITETLVLAERPEVRKAVAADNQIIRAHQSAMEKEAKRRALDTTIKATAFGATMVSISMMATNAYPHELIAKAVQGGAAVAQTMFGENVEGITRSSDKPGVIRLETTQADTPADNATMAQGTAALDQAPVPAALPETLNNPALIRAMNYFAQHKRNALGGANNIHEALEACHVAVNLLVDRDMLHGSLHGKTKAQLFALCTEKAQIETGYDTRLRAAKATTASGAEGLLQVEGPESGTKVLQSLAKTNDLLSDEQLTAANSMLDRYVLQQQAITKKFGAFSSKTWQAWGNIRTIGRIREDGPASAQDGNEILRKIYNDAPPTEKAQLLKLRRDPGRIVYNQHEAERGAVMSVVSAMMLSDEAKLDAVMVARNGEDGEKIERYANHNAGTSTLRLLNPIRRAYLEKPTKSLLNRWIAVVSAHHGKQNMAVFGNGHGRIGTPQDMDANIKRLIGGQVEQAATAVFEAQSAGYRVIKTSDGELGLQPYQPSRLTQISASFTPHIPKV